MKLLNRIHMDGVNCFVFNIYSCIHIILTSLLSVITTIHIYDLLCIMPLIIELKQIFLVNFDYNCMED